MPANQNGCGGKGAIHVFEDLSAPCHGTSCHPQPPVSGYAVNCCTTCNRPPCITHHMEGDDWNCHGHPQSKEDKRLEKEVVKEFMGKEEPVGWEAEFKDLFWNNDCKIDDYTPGILLFIRDQIAKAVAKNETALACVHCDDIVHDAIRAGAIAGERQRIEKAVSEGMKERTQEYDPNGFQQNWAKGHNAARDRALRIIRGGITPNPKHMKDWKDYIRDAILDGQNQIHDLNGGKATGEEITDRMGASFTRAVEGIETTYPKIDCSECGAEHSI